MGASSTATLPPPVCAGELPSIGGPWQTTHTRALCIQMPPRANLLATRLFFVFVLDSVLSVRLVVQIIVAVSTLHVYNRGLHFEFLRVSFSGIETLS